MVTGAFAHRPLSRLVFLFIRQCHKLCMVIDASNQESAVMDFYKFRMLDKNEQIDLLYKEGIYIGKLKEGNSIVVLYQLDSFYVKIFYQKYRCYVNRLYCFTSTALLEPFLDQVNVNDMVKC